MTGRRLAAFIFLLAFALGNAQAQEPPVLEAAPEIAPPEVFEPPAEPFVDVEPPSASMAPAGPDPATAAALHSLSTSVETLGKNLTVVTGEQEIKVLLGGTVQVDALYNSARPVAAGTPFFLTPRGPFDDETFDIHGRSSTVFLGVQGPKLGDFETGGLILLSLYNDSITVDRYGILPIQAFGELKNDCWRIAGGLQLDIFAPVIPTVLPFSILAGSGNTGMYRGQLRVERFLHLASDEQVTITAGITDPNPTILTNDTLSEDNGWPNIEARAAWAVGELQQAGLDKQRPFEVGVSGFVGQVRSTDLAVPVQVEPDTWGLAADWRWRVNECWGLAGEVFTGRGLGTYGGGILQTVNTATLDSIRATGGWMELYYYLTPTLHSHSGYGIDDPDDGDLAVGQVSRNSTFFTNLLWDVSKFVRVGFEVTYRDTEYVVLPGNDGVGLHGQLQWKF